MPVPREFVVEADGGSRGNPGPAGYGAVVLDPVSGETLAEAAEYIGVATNNVAEYKGLVAGLKAAHALDPEALVRVRMDSKLVVEQMSGRWKIKHPDMKPLAAEAARVFPPAQVTYEWIPRERNKHADRLANEAMDAGKRGHAVGAVALHRGARRTRRGVRARGRRRGGRCGEGTGGAGPHRGLDRCRRSRRLRRGRGRGTPGDARACVRRMGRPRPGAARHGRLLRHGETVLTPEKRFSGSGGSDPALSAVGRRQADAVAAALAERGTIQAIVSSPLRRCRETADAVASRLGLPVSVEEGLRETDFAAWEGLTYAEVRERYPDDLEAWLASPKAAPTGGGESFATVARRVAATRDKLLALHQGRTVLLVTHVTPVKTLVRLALGAPPESLFRMELSAASLSAVAYYADGNASLRLLNDTSHLR
ncbi:bifunctional RNase H/acid phosphatase [Streptomyces pristinaespiralis ATCC 25486]|uniref:Bifunctional RNase H/acid phosphatase n=1 Tax=Streptomyces pristinaespiralis (strain ATCC 25486 / DSM 40338 / CBS 914.69 / JCM 4507 / KCC S-0507 / NBRC 13074 / NRRL 2958 / 5647) TaxID=457429 RepID=D6X857_STRE2|nr:bifunctional RNase H/acid phosphatase [Streptomyces pristinaespiralis]EFH31713.1 bifunctional RNase H/acid phosphatase [Streptomyces pristinaespiralis ATCC 25486]